MIALLARAGRRRILTLRGGALACLVLPLMISGCSADGAGPDQPDLPWSQTRELDRLSLDQVRYLLEPLGSVQAAAHGFYAGETTAADFSAVVQWSIEDPSVVTVTDGGLLTAVGEGSTVLTATVPGVASASAVVGVGVGPFAVEVESGGGAQIGKMAVLSLRAPELDLGDAQHIDLRIDGLIPFGIDGVDEAGDPWWGVDGLDSELYSARFLVSPMATLGGHAIEFTMDDELPLEDPEINILQNTTLSGVQNCSFFDASNQSNWNASDAPNQQAMTFTIGTMDTDTIYRYTASSPEFDLAPMLWKWDLAGDLVSKNLRDPSITPPMPRTAALQFTALQPFPEAAAFLTASISEDASPDEQDGYLLTDCFSHQLPPPQISAVEADALFAPGGTAFGPGETSATFNLSGAAISGTTVRKIYVYLDIDIQAGDVTTVKVESPQGTVIDLIDTQWTTDYLQGGGRLVATFGAPAPFLQTADEFDQGGIGMLSFDSQPAGGPWKVRIDAQTASNAGTWYDARLWVQAD